MPDDGISPAYGHTWIGDAQVTAALGYTMVANDGSPHFFDGPSDSANVVTPTPGVTTTAVWKRRYSARTKMQSFKLVFYKGQTITANDITLASTASLQGTQ